MVDLGEEPTSNPFGFESLFEMFSANAPEKAPHTSIYDEFKLPIEYVDQSSVYSVSEVVSSDLELLPTDHSGNIIEPFINRSESERLSMYEYLCNPTDVFSQQMIRNMQSKYTTDVEFLKNTQDVLYTMGDLREQTSTEGFTPDSTTFLEIWKELKEDARFVEKHSYIDFSMLEYLNHSSRFLQVLAILNIFSPLCSLLIPLLFFIFPFVLVRLRGVPITFEEYIQTLREISKNHFIGKMLNVQFTIEGILYLFFTGGLYCLQTYQNVKSCQRFYQNITKINRHLLYLKSYIRYSIRRMETFLLLTEGKPLNTYRAFRDEVVIRVDGLHDIYDTLHTTFPFAYNYQTACGIGDMLHCYYQLYSNADYESTLRYVVGFHAYVDNLEGIYANIQRGHLGKTEFVDNEGEETVFDKQFYPPTRMSSPTTKCVSNTCDLSTNIIITGVNASGKTTFLKTTAINILFSQQFGVGFYRGAKLRPYTHIHSYLNIPDTSGRDSLFQAESRRCKEIIDIIESTKTTPGVRHFCIFDELYSGTNPDEATKSATSLLRYLANHDNVRFILTTHYISVCKKFRKNDRVRNYKMNVRVSDTGNIEYLYTIKRGVSKIQGGVEILKMMDYPEEILNDIQQANKKK